MFAQRFRRGVLIPRQQKGDLSESLLYTREHKALKWQLDAKSK